MSQLADSIADLKTNAKQWEAFTAPTPCVVLAPPGSGKTKLLTTRLASDLIETIPAPHGAACITLTNAAADELRRRLDSLGVVERSTLFVGTVHSFALRRVISPLAHLAGESWLSAVNVASVQQQNQAYRQAIAEVYGQMQDVRLVRSTIEFHRRRLSDLADWMKSGQKIVDAGRRYEEILRDAGLVDFDGAVGFAVRLVEQHEFVRRVLTSRYRNLYVDEYQDLAPGLDRLVRALCFDQGQDAGLFAVGDPDQAVFGWTGSRPELLHELAGRRGVNPVFLDHNYRCGVEIIRVANLMRRSNEPVTGSRSGGRVSAVRRSGGFADQCQGAVASANDAIGRGVALHEIVVICPANELCQTAASALRHAGISAFVRGSEYRQVLSTMFVEACAAWSALGYEISGYRLGELLRRWRRLLRSSWTREKDVELTKLLVGYENLGAESASAFLQALLDLGLRSAVEKSSRSDEALELAQMGEALSVGALGGLSVGELGERARRVDRVEVTTMTSSKGLEFDVVIVLGLDEKVVPDFRSIDDPLKLAEDRRKFYVSVTRAREEVHLFYSGFVQWKSGRRDYAGPSRFLGEIGMA